MSRYSRREFIKTGVSFGAASILAGKAAPASIQKTPATTGVVRVVSSGNGLRATEKAMELLRQGADPLDAVIAGVNIVEEDPNDMSVGYGGLPNEDGVVELDASVMHGPTHSAGAVAALRNIKNPVQSGQAGHGEDRPLLFSSGRGPCKFAKAHGFKEEDLLTEKAREKSGSAGRKPFPTRTTGCAPPEVRQRLTPKSPGLMSPPMERSTASPSTRKATWPA